MYGANVTGTVASIDASVSNSTNGRERLDSVSVVTCVWQAVAPPNTIDPGCQNEGTVNAWAAMSLPPWSWSVVTPPQGVVATVGSLPNALYSV
jgi:hypothetical protein